MVFGSGMLVTIATLIAMPQNRVVFGVLTCIGSCMLILTFTEKLWKKIPAEAGAVLTFLTFLVTKNINSGWLGPGSHKMIEIPGNWYRNYLTAYLGFPFPKFYSTDYFSLLPWFFLFITGFYLHGIIKKYGIMEKKFWQKGILPFMFLGKHSLMIYLLHQPVIYGIQEILFR